VDRPLSHEAFAGKNRSIWKRGLPALKDAGQRGRRMPKPIFHLRTSTGPGRKLHGSMACLPLKTNNPEKPPPQIDPASRKPLSKGQAMAGRDGCVHRCALTNGQRFFLNQKPGRGSSGRASRFF